jgi:Sugar (and other) transporter
MLVKHSSDSMYLRSQQYNARRKLTLMLLLVAIHCGHSCSILLELQYLDGVRQPHISCVYHCSFTAIDGTAGTLPPALILACLLVMPESPRWLVSQNKLRAARDVLRRVLGDDREAIERYFL